MATFVAPTAFSVARAQKFLKTATDGTLFLFAADHRPSSNTTVPQVSEAVSNVVSEPWQQMLFGKEVKQAALGIRNLPYTFGLAYDRYDDQLDMSSLDWYAVVNSGAYSHVFVCLDNGGGANSTVQPDVTQATAAATLSYQTSDGYRWMYMNSTDSGTIANLATSTLFPMLPNTATSSSAVEGRIDVVSTQFGGKNYNNYVAGTFQASDIKVDGIPTLYQMSNSSIASVNGYYTGCVMVITGGVGAGQFATITDYEVTADGNFANLNVTWAVTPINGSTFEVYPGVTVGSDGRQTDSVVARALVNAVSSNSVWSVEVLDPGAGYFGPVTANVVANVVVGVTSVAQVTPILPPRGGHGFDQATELGATSVLVGCTFSNTEGGLVPATNTYRQIGFLRNPGYANVQFTLTNPGSSLFDVGEDVLVMTLREAEANASVNVQSVVVTGDTRMFQSGSNVYVSSSGTDQFVGVVNTITNSTSMNLASNSQFTGNGVQLYLPTVVSQGWVVSAPSTTNVLCSGIGPMTNTGMTLMGTLSGAGGTVTALTRNGVSKDFSTFVELRKFSVTSLGGTFVQNEVVIQGNTTGLVQSYANNTLYVSNMTGSFTVGGNNVTGNTSGAVAQVTAAYDPEVLQRSGTIEYLENLADPLTRGPSQAESFVVPYQF